MADIIRHPKSRQDFNVRGVKYKVLLPNGTEYKYTGNGHEIIILPINYEKYQSFMIVSEFNTQVRR